MTELEMDVILDKEEKTDADIPISEDVDVSLGTDASAGKESNVVPTPSIDRGHDSAAADEASEVTASLRGR